MHFCFLETEVGQLRLRGDDEGLREISFPNRAQPGVETGPQTSEPFREAIAQLEAYFRGQLREFDLALAPVGTEFQRKVWSHLRTIPYGETTTYGEIARRLGRPSASRAVGAANGQNPLPIVVPCHRVIGASGALTGFGGGLDVKRRLLALESAHREPDRIGSQRDLLFSREEAG
jgi:methylated-DNA-[protein]-cysteine S-methyltransferase